MGVLTNEQKVKILSEIVAIPSVNDNELAVAQYLENGLIDMILTHTSITFQENVQI